jgi:hypothetical protein
LLFSYGLRNFLDFDGNNSVMFLDIFGIVLEAPDDMASLVFVPVFDKL